MITEAKSGHPGGSLSAIDLITALFFHEMKGVDSKHLSPSRDRFVLSKGHGVPALYAVLAKKGFIPFDELKTLRRTGSRLQGHPDRVRLPIVEASTGSLGQGLSMAQGMALGLKTTSNSPRVFCLIGDGEMQEGQIWEAAMSAPKFKLSNLRPGSVRRCARSRRTPRPARLMGIRTGRVIAFTFAVGSSLAALGAVLYCLDQSQVYPTMGVVIELEPSWPRCSAELAASRAPF